MLIKFNRSGSSSDLESQKDLFEALVRSNKEYVRKYVQTKSKLDTSAATPEADTGIDNSNDTRELHQRTASKEASGKDGTDVFVKGSEEKAHEPMGSTANEPSVNEEVNLNRPAAGKLNGIIGTKNHTATVETQSTDRFYGRTGRHKKSQGTGAKPTRPNDSGQPQPTRARDIDTESPKRHKDIQSIPGTGSYKQSRSSEHCSERYTDESSPVPHRVRSRSRGRTRERQVRYNISPSPWDPSVRDMHENFVVDCFRRADKARYYICALQAFSFLQSGGSYGVRARIVYCSSCRRDNRRGCQVLNHVDILEGFMVLPSSLLDHFMSSARPPWNVVKMRTLQGWQSRSYRKTNSMSSSKAWQGV